MDFSTAEKRRIFMTCRSVFSSTTAQLRSPKKIKKLLLKHGGPAKDLVKELGMPKVVLALSYLLAKGVFQSELNARVEFPELYESEYSRTVQRAASEDEAARSESEMLDAIDAEVEHLESTDVASSSKHCILPAPQDIVPEISPGNADVLTHAESNLTLYPSYLPYKAQHLVLTTTQRLLEDCCFDFAKMWLPNVLVSRKWDCSEAVELTEWLKVLNHGCGKIPAHAFAVPISSIQGTFSSARRLRHTSVHRLPITAKGICQLVQSAARFSEALRDPLRTAQLEALAQMLRSLTRDMELHKNFLENSLDINLQTIRQQQAELKQREEALIAMTKKEDAEKKKLVGSLLEDSVRRIMCNESDLPNPPEEAGSFEEISSAGEN